MIYYFSGTGNSRWAATTIAKATGDRLAPMGGDDECKLTLAEGEPLGFVFPVHGWQPPGVVRRFVERLAIANAAGAYTFVLCTCGDSAGLTVEMLSRQLRRRGLPPIDSAWSLTMPESYVCLPFMDVDTKKREREKIARAAERLREIAEAISHRRRGVWSITKGAAPWLLTHVVGEAFRRTLVTDRHFRAGQGCTGCGQCAKVCPVGNIVGGKGKAPQWRHDGRCTACLACYHHCPAHAISFGPLTKRRGQYFFSYEL